VKVSDTDIMFSLSDAAIDRIAAQVAERAAARADGATALPPDQPATLAVPALLSVAKVASLLDCSPRTIRRRLADGSLRGVREHGRTMVRADELRAYIDALERYGADDARRSRRSSAGSYDFLRQ
jgi:excisionase family DNA binding protein